MGNTKNVSIVFGSVLIILGIAALVGKRPKQPSFPVKQIQPQFETPSQPPPTAAELEQNRMNQARQNLANTLNAKLNDAGFDVIVTAFGDKLNLHGDVFTDTATRVQILQTIRSMPDFCAVGFREVSMGAGVFSSSDYSLHC